jgi:hypothetical protein
MRGQRDAPKPVFRTVLGLLYEGDCLALLPTLKSRSVDTVFADPPFMHLKESLVLGKIDIGIIVVPDDTLSKFLTDRTPNLATAVKHVEHRASDLPIRVLAFKHDGVGPPLEKMRTNLGKGS